MAPLSLFAVRVMTSAPEHAHYCMRIVVYVTFPILRSKMIASPHDPANLRPHPYKAVPVQSIRPSSLHTQTLVHAVIAMKT